MVTLGLILFALWLVPIPVTYTYGSKTLGYNATRRRAYRIMTPSDRAWAWVPVIGAGMAIYLVSKYNGTPKESRKSLASLWEEQNREEVSEIDEEIEKIRQQRVARLEEQIAIARRELTRH